MMTFPATTLPIGSNPSTVYVVASSSDPAPAASCFRVVLAWGTSQNNSARMIHKGCWTPQAFADTFNTWQQMHPSQEWPTDHAALVRADFSAAEVRVEMNGKPSFSWETSVDNPLATAAAPQATLGAARWDPNGAWQGTIAEVIVLSYTPTPSEDAAIQQYLSVKWGI
jgi:hypothetical protein